MQFMPDVSHAPSSAAQRRWYALRRECRVAVAARSCWPPDTSLPCVLSLSFVLLRRVLVFQHNRGGCFMQLNEFHRPFSVDFAPQGSLCEWCGKPAERQLTAI